jgi:hypothetical protein
MVKLALELLPLSWVVNIGILGASGGHAVEE